MMTKAIVTAVVLKWSYTALMFAGAHLFVTSDIVLKAIN